MAMSLSSRIGKRIAECYNCASSAAILVFLFLRVLHWFRIRAFLSLSLH